jgi:hypothetical protein
MISVPRTSFPPPPIYPIECPAKYLPTGRKQRYEVGIAGTVWWGAIGLSNDRAFHEYSNANFEANLWQLYRKGYSSVDWWPVVDAYCYTEWSRLIGWLTVRGRTKDKALIYSARQAWIEARDRREAVERYQYRRYRYEQGHDGFDDDDIRAP